MNVRMCNIMQISDNQSRNNDKNNNVLFFANEFLQAFASYYILILKSATLFHESLYHALNFKLIILMIRY